MTQAQAIKFDDIFLQGVDPYPLYHYMRNLDPVHWSPNFLQAWFIFSYTDVLTIKRNPVCFSNAVIPPATLENPCNTLWLTESKALLFKDAADHKRVRNLACKALTPERQETMRPRTQELANALLDQVQDVGQMDVMDDFAIPLTITLLCDLLGSPKDDLKTLKQWTVDIFRALDYAAEPELVEYSHGLARKLLSYFSATYKERYKNPKDDVISALITVEENGDKLTQEEVLAILFQIFTGSHDDIANLIGNSILALLSHPEQLELLKENPSLIENAVEEFLRYDTPLLGVMRIATQDIQLGSKKIQKGQQVFLLYGAANRDPEQFPEPDKLDITRSNSHLHFSLGHGSHYCPGAQLVRIQVEVAINTLIQRMPNLRLNSDKLEWRKSFYERTLNALPVTFTPRTAI